MRYPWERALATDLARLDSSLKAYFSAIPAGSVGRGSGTFDSVGTPRRWLWPVLFVLARAGIAFPVWEHGVPFTIVNEPTAHGTVRARRVFHFASGDRTMSDEIGMTRSGLVDRLGRPGIILASLSATVVEGHLELRSTSIALRFGRIHIELGPLSPVVTLVERAADGGQHVSLTIEMPVLGRLYEYSGHFTYRIEPHA